jgi:hypothetical protein
MDLYDINSLRKGTDGKYDLTQLTFQYRNDVELYQYQVQKGEEMRIDLVCESIYGTTEYLDIIMHINNIDNPLNIKEGIILKYPSPGKIDLFRIKEETPSLVQDKIININKTTRKDSNREKYIKQGYSLPPVVLEKAVDPVRIEGDNIVIGGNNF